VPASSTQQRVAQRRRSLRVHFRDFLAALATVCFWPLADFCFRSGGSMPRKVDAYVELRMRRRRTCSLSSTQCRLSQVANLLRVQLLLLPLVSFQ